MPRPAPSVPYTGPTRALLVDVDATVVETGQPDWTPGDSILMTAARSTLTAYGLPWARQPFTAIEGTLRASRALCAGRLEKRCELATFGHISSVADMQVSRHCSTGIAM